MIGSHNVAKNDAQTSRNLFEDSSSNIVSTLSLAIQRERDIVVTMDAYFVAFPSANQRDFKLWMSSLTVLKRYPELSGVAEIVLVPRSQLAKFEASAVRDPAGALGPGGTFGLSPAGNRPYYCLAKVSVSRRGDSGPAAGLDYCGTPLGPLFMKARDSGLGAYLPYGSGKSQELVIGTPIYKTGVAPTTVLKRRGALLGWTGTELVPNVLLATSLRGYPNTAVKFQFNSGNIVATFRAGKAPRGAQTMSTNLHNGWRIETYAGVNNGSIFSNVNALALLLVGLALSMLLGAMLYILGTGRSRALGLVKERTSDLEHLALHDVLTGLPNRALILDRIGQMIARVRRDHTGSALLFLDLDNFKDINDTLGHTVGDQLLVEVGKRLTSILREGDTVGRLSGDEFVILAEGDSLHPDAGALGQRILDALSESFTVKDCAAALSVSASIGIAQGERNHPEDLLRDADIAMYRAKGAGKNRVVAFVPSMQEDVVVRRALGVDLQKALDNEEFFLMYQPIVDLKSGIITGAEALLRWRHPERGVIQPDQFIPALESSGLIIPVGLWVLGEACRQGFEWLERGVWLDLSVNISARQLEYDQIVDDVKNVLTLSVYPADMLTLELTETTLMADVEDSIERLRLLKSLGIRLAIDDFGTGYSSIAYLRQFPVDGIKIDRSFVSNIVETAEAASLVHTLIQLGKDLGLSTVAEGVETDAQRLKLIAEDADFAQGFLFARPLLADDIEALAKLNAMSGNGIQ